MKRYSLYTVVLVIFWVLMVISFVLIYFSVTQHKEDLLEAAIEEKIHLAATINETIVSPLWFYQVAMIPGLEKAFVNEMAQFRDVQYIRIVRLDGRIAQSSIEDEWGKIIEDPDIERALTTKRPIVRDEIFRGEKLKTIIHPGYRDNTIWVAFTLKSVEEAARAILVRGILVALGGLILIILATFLILRTIVSPLKKMTTACQEVRKGNLDVKVEAISKTEIGELATAFNEMIKDLRQSQTTLEESKAVLEIKVAARTKELRELAESLEEEVKRRTKEIQERVVDLELFHKLAVGRELRMIELKKEIKRLKEKLKGRKSQ